MSERAAAKKLDVARTTLRHWNQQAYSDLIPASIQAALLTEDGLHFLNLILTALQFVMNQAGKAGIRLVQLFLDLTSLSSFVSGSYGTLQARGVLMENNINEFGSTEKHRLAVGMPNKEISVSKDETFNNNVPCLVAIEPVSNYILTEKYTEKRTADNWDAALQESLADLNVTVIQNVNDSGTAIKKYNEEHHKNANESPNIGP